MTTEGKPILSAIKVFDASVGANITFTYYNSYSSITRVQYFIYDSITGLQVASGDVNVTGSQMTSRIRTITLPANIEDVSNRAAPYQIKIRCFYNDIVQSELSDAMLIYCHAKPSFYFMDMDAQGDNEIQYASYDFVLLSPDLSEKFESLNTYRFYLYDSNKNVLKESKAYYGAPSAAFSVEGLEDEASYYVRAVGGTVSGYALDTGYVKITVYYKMKSGYPLIKVSNDYANGQIDIKSNIMSIDGKSSSPVTYEQISGGNYGVVIEADQEVTFDMDYVKLHDYVLRAKVKPKDGRAILKIKDENGLQRQLVLAATEFTPREIVDSTAAYRKVLPDAVGDYVTEVKSIGGHSEVVGGEVVNADVVRIRATGKNLFDKANPNILQNMVVNAGTLRINYNKDYDTLCVWIPCAPNTKYIVSKMRGNRFSVSDSSEEPQSNTALNKVSSHNTSSTITYATTEDAKYLVVYAWNTTYDTTISKDDALNSLQVELGDAATVYEPYRDVVCQIPEAVRNMPAYGASVGDVYNEVDYHNRQYIQRVGVAEPIVTDLSDILTTPLNIDAYQYVNLFFEQSDNTTLSVPSTVAYSFDNGTPQGTYYSATLYADGITIGSNMLEYIEGEYVTLRLRCFDGLYDLKIEY